MRTSNRTIQVRAIKVSVVGVGVGTIILVGWGVAIEQYK